MPAPHQTRAIGIPELVAVGSEPSALVIVPLILEANGDAIAGERPELLDQAVVLLFLPLSPQELDDRGTTRKELGAIAPAAVDAVRERHPLGVARIPGIFSEAHLARSGFGAERRHDHGRRYG